MERLFCAIDTGDPAAARALAKSLAGVVGGVKPGAAFVVENASAESRRSRRPAANRGCESSRRRRRRTGRTKRRPRAAWPEAPADRAFRLADLARRCGLNGAWTSARDPAALRARLGPDFLLVAPGVRPVWARTGDRTHIVTPGDALRRGADYPVVGRPITQADDPRAAAARIAEEMAAAIG